MHTTARLPQLDAIKTMAIFLVCYYHGAPVVLIKSPPRPDDFGFMLEYFLHALPVIAVPLFFMVSGALALNRPLDLRRHAARTWRVLWLTLLWGCITNAVVMTLRGDPMRATDLVLGTFKLKPGYTNHLWFLHAMLMVYLLHPLFKQAYDRVDEPRPFLWGLAALMAFGFGATTFSELLDVARAATGRNFFQGKDVMPFRDVAPFGDYAFALGYYLLGGLLGRGQPAVVARTSRARLVAVFVASWLLLFAVGVTLSMAAGSAVDTVFPFYASVMAFAMSVSAFALVRGAEAASVPASSFMHAVGAATLGIYLLHPLINVALQTHGSVVLATLARASVLGAACYAALLLAGGYFATRALCKLPLVRETVKA